MPDADVIVVGAGLAGLSAAYRLAKLGRNVIVLERGEYPGSKNVTGGRMYLHAIKKNIDIPISEMPFERFVVRECITFLDQSSSVTLELNNYNVSEPMSATVLRARFDRWFSERVEERGATIITKAKVDDLILEDGFVKGVIVGGEKLTSNVTIIAEGVNSFLAEKLGLRKSFVPESVTVAAKGIVELGEEEINKRFNLKDKEGVAHAIIGFTNGVHGGGFIYTDREVVSIGVVCLLKSLVEHGKSIADIFEDFRLHPAVQRYIEGGKLVEYSGHLTPELGYNMIPKIYSNGVLIAGDAAGFFLEGGPILRGMDFAIESGSLAAEAANIALNKNDYSEQTLKIYMDLLNDSFVLRDLRMYKNSPKAISNPRLYTSYPKLVNQIFTQLMHIDGNPRPHMGSIIFNNILRNGQIIYLLRDIFDFLASL
ncbi:MAG TPA: FAD-dependent oxidoreductase [Geobacterales bacterium]|nr:FAD-dependent oxidoreductase [Geobacterales bacterium]